MRLTRFACVQQQQQISKSQNTKKIEIIFFSFCAKSDCQISYHIVWFMALAMRFPAVFGNISFELISCSAFALRLSVALAFFSLLFIYLFILLFHYSLLELELHLEFVSNLCANWNSMDCGQLNGFASPLGNPVPVSLPPYQTTPLNSLPFCVSLSPSHNYNAKLTVFASGIQIANMSTFFFLIFILFELINVFTKSLTIAECLFCVDKKYNKRGRL